jgi:hypothetical protein
MMEPNPARPARKVAIADHLWETFEEMAAQMGSDRDGLVNQAMFMFARLNGFLNNGQGSVMELDGASKPSRSAAPVLASVPSARREERSASSSRLENDPGRRQVAERVLETAAELERLIKGKGESAEEPDEISSGGGIPEADSGAVEDASAGSEGMESAPEGGQLFLVAEGGEMDKIAKDRFVIGRGKHCDFVINSGKVSREHAVISRDGEEYFIEDLGSSNGTWFNKQRIKRRKIEDGDEYYICSEKIKLVMR